MSFSRRRFLMLFSAVNLLAPFRRLLATPISSRKSPLDTDDRRCLDAWIETLMPADEFSPGAGELGVSLQIAHKAVMNRAYLKLVKAGCRWLNTQARAQGGQNFAALDEADREVVARLTEGSQPGSTPRLFFERTLDDTFLYYYARRESWVMLAYHGPPQPLGFMDYTRPPQA